VDDVGFKAQGNTTTGDFTIDDLLVGTTWSDVAPGTVPEPSVFALGGLGLLALLRFRRQR
jgi:MYXO-CTERM domain-containing protein